MNRIFFFVTFTILLGFFGFFTYQKKFSYFDNFREKLVDQKSYSGLLVEITSKKKWKYLIETTNYSGLNDIKEFWIDVWKWRWFFVDNNCVLTSKHVVDDLSANYSIIYENNSFFVSKIWHHKYKDLAVVFYESWIAYQKDFVLSDRLLDTWEIVFSFFDIDSWELNNIGKVMKLNSVFSEFTWLYLVSLFFEDWYSGGPVFDTMWYIIGVVTAKSLFDNKSGFITPFLTEDIDWVKTVCK